MNRHIPDTELDRYSSAVTLSDMEIFVYPELLYPLVLANLMSPRVWAWRSDPWFERFDSLSPYRRILRLKQYIMDHYDFNLDLETWGLTTQRRELDRFSSRLAPEAIARSNALFGYEGDRFYFDLDIRRHFGLDRLPPDAIPYWKTETVEAMDAFRHMPGHARGAGECVSLSTLYAAALYALCGIPLDDIFLIATPLHSQNFVAVADGILTNNRRLVTRAMWFNGTPLSAKARRALEHEQITIVSHVTGHAHSLYPSSTISPAAYARFQTALSRFVQTPLTPEILVNFLRQAPRWQPAFQIPAPPSSWIPAERAFAAEAASPYKLSDSTRPKLLSELDPLSDASLSPLPDRTPLDAIEALCRPRPLDLASSDDRSLLLRALSEHRPADASALLADLRSFTHLEPRWPKPSIPLPPPNAPSPAPALDLPPGLTRQEIIDRLSAARATVPTAELAFYAYRDLSTTDPRPHLQAALERSPVCVKGLSSLSDANAYSALLALPSESIYDGPFRLAQPDELWNAQRGDGTEKALTLAAVLHFRHPDAPMTLSHPGDGTALLTTPSATYPFPAAKPLPHQSWPLDQTDKACPRT